MGNIALSNQTSFDSDSIYTAMAYALLSYYLGLSEDEMLARARAKRLICNASIGGIASNHSSSGYIERGRGSCLDKEPCGSVHGG